MPLQPLDEVQRHRVDPAKSESDAAHFYQLLYLGELVLKLTVGGLVACVEDGKDRHRYRLEHGLVRADGLGTWAQVADEVLVGPASQELVQAARNSAVTLAKKQPTDSKEHTAIVLLDQVIS